MGKYIKKLGIVIVFIVVIIIGIYFITGARGPSTDARTGLLVYPESEFYDLTVGGFETMFGSLPEAAEFSAYLVDHRVSPFRVQSWYKDHMDDWELVEETPWTEETATGIPGGGLLYRKGDEFAGIVVTGNPYGGGTFYVLVRGSWSDAQGYPGYPAISATSAKSGDNEIRINVDEWSGSIPTGEWAYSVSSTEGSYSWTTGTEILNSPYVSLGTYAAGTYYVSLKHLDSGHFYFNDQTITTS